MKILICCESYFPSGGGVARVNQEIAERLAKQGHDVTVATTKVPQRSDLKPNGVKIAQFAASGNLVRGMEGEIQPYKEFVILGGYDVLFVYAAQQWTFDALWDVLHEIKARKVHVPCGYSSLYDPSFKEYFQRMPAILHAFDHLIFNSSNYRDIEFARQCGLINYSLIANGASEIEFSQCPIPDFRKKWGISEDEFIFITVGSPPLSKGHREVVLAYDQLQLPFPSILIIDGKYTPSTDPRLQTVTIKIKRFLTWMARIALRTPVFSSKGFGKAIKNINNQAGKRFLFTDMQRADLISALFASNLFVFASHLECSPLVLFESVAAGLPFLSVPSGNAEEIAQWTKGGEICPAEKNKTGHTMVHPAMLAEKMTQLATDPKRLSQLGRQGRDSWKANYTWEILMKQYEDAIVGV